MRVILTGGAGFIGSCLLWKLNKKGVRDIIRKKMDLEVMIPMKNQRMSLNVAHATSMMCYEIVRQKK